MPYRSWPLILVLLVGGLSAVEKPAAAEIPWPRTGFGLSLVVDHYTFDIEDTHQPFAVQMETENPFIFSPWTGNAWNFMTIPREALDYHHAVSCFGLRLSWSPPLDFPVLPYVAVRLQQKIIGSEKDIYQDLDEVTLGDLRWTNPTEWVLYVFGYDIERDGLLEPEAGLVWRIDPRHAVTAGLSAERMTIVYYKGIEGFMTPLLMPIAAQDLELLHWRAGYRASPEPDISVMPEVMIVTESGDVVGWGASLALQVNL